MSTTRFYEIRREALEVWTFVTGRQISDELGELSTDNFAGAYECKWQNEFEDSHVNLFCSLGEWACNITDVLKETKYDVLYFENKEEAKVLFRYYTRLLLLISEMLTDFQDIYLHSENLPHSKKMIARKYYSPFTDRNDFTELLNYINCVCKHKTQHIHSCNNHCDLIFEDSGTIPESFQYVKLGDIDTGHTKNAILVPKLSNLIALLTRSYSWLDTYFKENRDKYLSLCNKFKASNHCT